MAVPSMDALIRDLLESNSSVRTVVRRAAHFHPAYHARARMPVSF
jgi:hypothetical protein